MKTTHEQTIYQLTFMPRLFPVNCVLVEEDDGLTLVDAALPYSAKGILKAALRIGKPITRVVLTHAHGDHIGALKGLKEALPNVRVCISARDARLLAGDTSLDPDEPDTPINGGVPKAGDMPEADVLLKDGDRVGSLLAVAAPGHTPGHMAFLDTRNRALVAGDAFQTRGGVAVSGWMRPLFPFPAWATWNLEQALETAKRLVELRPSLVTVGHGHLLTDPAVALKRAISTAEQKPSAVLKAGAA